MATSSSRRRKSSKRVLAAAFAGDELLAELREYAQNARPHQPIAAERRLAEEYGISYGTVRKAVAQLADEGLVYKVQGKGLFATGSNREMPQEARTILFVDDWGQVDHPFCMRKLSGVLDSADQGAYRVEVHRAPAILDLKDHETLLREVARPEVAGMIVPWLPPTLSSKARQTKPGLKIVTGSHEEPTPGVGCVLHNAFSFGYQAADYLLGAGVRRLLCVRKPAHSLQGLSARLNEVDDPFQMIQIPWDKGDSVESVVAQGLAAQPDGLLFTDDRMAMTMIQALLQQAAERITQVTIVSSANAGEDYLPPYVARLEQDGYEVGMMSMALLKAMIEGKPVASPIMKIEPKLVLPAQTMH